MKQNLKNIYITEEDMRFFRYLYAVKVSTYERVNRDIYINHKYKGVSGRILKWKRTVFWKCGAT